MVVCDTSCHVVLKSWVARTCKMCKQTIRNLGVLLSTNCPNLRVSGERFLDFKTVLNWPTLSSGLEKIFFPSQVNKFSVIMNKIWLRWLELGWIRPVHSYNFALILPITIIFFIYSNKASKAAIEEISPQMILARDLGPTHASCALLLHLNKIL